MKVEKKEIVLGSTVGIIIGLILGLSTIALLDMVRENNQYNEYMIELEFHEEIRAAFMEYRPRLSIEFSDYIFEEYMNGNKYLVWIKYDDVFDNFDYSYASFGK